jgi:hypothetical protein
MLLSIIAVLLIGGNIRIARLANGAIVLVSASFGICDAICAPFTKNHVGQLYDLWSCSLDVSSHLFAS